MASGAPVVVSSQASSNIAVIKYWGKRDESLLLPLNSSGSFTLNAAELGTTTTVAASPSFERDRLWLNGKEEDVNAPRIQNCLKRMRERSSLAHHVHIVSKNNFPTAAGMASSASGFACLVHALSQLFEFKEAFPGELSAIARVGSGSACRSMYGGLVRWNMGKEADGSDSMAQQILDQAHWPELEILILVVNEGEKDTSSTSGMQLSRATSTLLKERLIGLDDKLAQIEEAIAKKDFPTFARITMQDSNQMHAVCLDTYPPIFYMNDTSRSIINFVHAQNRLSAEPTMSYTFDAGPNAVLFTTRPHLPTVMANLLATFPPASGVSLDSYCQGSQLHAHCGTWPVPAGTAPLPASAPGCLSRIIHTTVGEGPSVLPASAHLIDAATGLPL